MRKSKATDRPYRIAYIKGDRCLRDSATTLARAMERIARRAAKVKGERAILYYQGKPVDCQPR
jgi:hypothetical protein